MHKLFSRLTVWIFLAPSLLLSAVAYSLFPKWLRQPFFLPTRWLLDLRKNYMPPVKFSQSKSITLPEKIDLAYVDQLGHNEFEHFVAKLLETRGYTQVTVTQASGDFGVDIIARKGETQYAVQAKHYNGNVSFKAVQEAVAGIKIYKCQAAMVITNSYFTNQAKVGAREADCELVDRDILKRWLDEYKWANSSSFFDQFRLEFGHYKWVIISLLSLVLLVLFYIVFSDPICQLLC